MKINYAHHGRQERNDEDVVGIGKETNTSHNASSYMVPAKRGLVDFRESKTSALIGIANVSEIIVEVVEGGVSSGGLSKGSDVCHGDKSGKASLTCSVDGKSISAKRMCRTKPKIALGRERRK